ncbi:hypothetical protein [Actinomadura macrotermitis]|nr:hypothetical protein [Actinomadura macrotermitis]
MRQIAGATLLSGAVVAGGGIIAAPANAAPAPKPAVHAAPAEQAPLHEAAPGTIAAQSTKHGFKTKGLPGVNGWGTYQYSSYKGRKTQLLWFKIKDSRSGKHAALRFLISKSKGKPFDEWVYWNRKDNSTTKWAGFHTYYLGRIYIREELGYEYRDSKGRLRFRTTNAGKWYYWK